MSGAAPVDELESIRQILEILSRLSADERARVLRYVHEKLGVVAPTTAMSAPQSALGQSASPGAKPNIRTFLEAKKPTTDVQFAAAVAYFNAFELPEEIRKAEIVGNDLQDAARLANRERLTKPIDTLHNANKLGYLDKGSARGAFKINTVGENLVAMALPATGEAAPKSRRRTKKPAKPK
jgi:hypothetical protein